MSCVATLCNVMDTVYRSSCVYDSLKKLNIAIIVIILLKTHT